MSRFSMSSASFNTDAARPSALPTADIGRRSQRRREDAAGGEGAEAELEQEEEKWNVAIDKEVKVLSSGLRELVETAQGTNPQPHQPPTDALNLTVRSAAMIRAAHNLATIAHQLKLLLLLSDERAIVEGRDEELRNVQNDVRARREELGKTLQSLVMRKEGEAIEVGSNEHGDNGGDMKVDSDTKP